MADQPTDQFFTFEQFPWVTLLPLLVIVWVLLGSYGEKRARKDHEFLSHLKCPKCQTAVRRMTRNILHRLLGFLFISVIDRYRCPQCQFQRTLWWVNGE